MLQRQFPKKVRVEQIGETIQGRDIDMIIISKNLKRPKACVLLEAGIHAREWITVSTALFFIDHLIRNPKLTDLMDFYVIPCLNPDGYEYTHTQDRLWRKNMNTNKSNLKECQGVDLNRNFPYKFGREPGSSKDKSSFMYRGRYALSEPESKALANTLCRYRKRVKLFISLHCFGNLIMFPWGYTEHLLDDRRDLVDCGFACKEAMRRECGIDRKFKVGSISKLMYYTTGCTTDYARGCHNIKFAYTIELQKGGKSGFVHSTRKIVEIGTEIVNGIAAMVKFIYRYYKKKENPRKPECMRSQCKRTRRRHYY
ncbi:hypothetical protein Trydic_g16625 [Trypoxylus dichotomus]